MVWDRVLVQTGRWDHGIGAGDADENDGNENTCSVAAGKSRQSEGQDGASTSMGDEQRGFFLPGGVRDRPGTSAINAAALWLCVSLILHQTITKILSWLITHSQKCK